VTRLIVGHMAVAIAAGAAAGVLVARLMSTWFASLLFRMSATDATVYAGVVGFVGLIAVVAAWAPTRRAARVNPVSALRAD
jgi:ABC-type antimicrobial peptide transport system permease subunit